MIDRQVDVPIVRRVLEVLRSNLQASRSARWVSGNTLHISGGYPAGDVLVLNIQRRESVALLGPLARGRTCEFRCGIRFGERH